MSGILCGQLCLVFSACVSGTGWNFSGEGGFPLERALYIIFILYSFCELDVKLCLDYWSHSSNYIYCRSCYIVNLLSVLFCFQGNTNLFNLWSFLLLKKGKMPKKKSRSRGFSRMLCHLFGQQMKSRNREWKRKRRFSIRINMIGGQGKLGFSKKILYPPVEDTDFQRSLPYGISILVVLTPCGNFAIFFLPPWNFTLLCVNPKKFPPYFPLPYWNSTIFNLRPPGVSELWYLIPPWKFRYPQLGIQFFSGKIQYIQH